MTVVDGDTFALNIVVDPSSSLSSARSVSTQQKKQLVRPVRNKYDRRRRKAAQAKDNKARNENEPVKEDKEETLLALPVQEQKVVEKEEEVSESDPNEDFVALNSPLLSEQQPLDEEVDAVENYSIVEEPLILAASSSSSSGLPQDVEERARYLAEFHARPLELDRRSGAAIRSSSYSIRNNKKSRESTHLYQENRTWDDFGLHPRLVSAVKDFKQPTVIQTKTLDSLLHNASRAKALSCHNVLIHSETGSGKTLAYILPILQSLIQATCTVGPSLASPVDRRQAGTRCIILCPTRELALQTLAVLESLCSQACNWIVPGCLYGEERRKSEKARIRKGLTILVATPGRLLDHLTRTEALLLSLKKGNLEWLVADEADRLLDMGLGEQVKQIVQRIRANQPGTGNQGITWRSVLVSATVTPHVELLAKESLLGMDSTWSWVKGKDSKTEATTFLEGVESPALTTAVVDNERSRTVEEDHDLELAESTPHQLNQLQITVSAKLRLPTLLAFLIQRIQKGERTVVFFSTCAAVDYYHALFQAVSPPILEPSAALKDGETADESRSSGIFGPACSIYKLHGNVPHGERHLTLKRFSKSSSKVAAILLATDVAARGLNLVAVDWTVQFDPPSEVADYVHRAGRAARAGKAGQSLLFLLPSEHGLLDILKKRGVKRLSALSLSSTLNSAASICRKVTQEGVNRSGGQPSNANGNNSRAGEAFASEIQRLLEESVVADDIKTRASHKEALARAGGGKRQKDKPDQVSGALLEQARAAFLAHVRAYPTKEKVVRHIFATKALHLGHIARSFALKEAPKKLGTVKRNTSAVDGVDKKRKSMEFKPLATEGSSVGMRSKSIDSKKFKSSHDNRTGREVFMASASRLGKNGLDSL